MQKKIKKLSTFIVLIFTTLYMLEFYYGFIYASNGFVEGYPVDSPFVLLALLVYIVSLLTKKQNNYKYLERLQIMINIILSVLIYFVLSSHIGIE